MDFLSKKCKPCEISTPPMPKTKAQKYLKDIQGWELAENDKLKIKRDFKFKDFKGSMDFVNNVANLAESEGHHPDIYIFYNKVNLILFTHAASGLSQNDFILASKINALLKPKTS